MQRNTISITIHQTQSQLRAAAMLQAGLSPKVMSMKPGTRVERDRRAATKRGYEKHEGSWLGPVIP